MSIMNIYKNIYLIKKTNNTFYKLPVNIVQNIYLKKNVDIEKLKITYLFILTLGMITYNRYIL